MVRRRRPIILVPALLVRVQDSSTTDLHLLLMAVGSRLIRAGNHCTISHPDLPIGRRMKSCIDASFHESTLPLGCSEEDY
mmetsp:Transcript_96794/g.144954  ORF Transcript_96794/g.144954 Transcript_96794/m.144954 type:complete len:80 (-) Transcript_96794:785-1024(-)